MSTTYACSAIHFCFPATFRTTLNGMSAVHEDASVVEEVPDSTPTAARCQVLSKGLAWNFCSIALNPFLQCYARSAKASNPFSVCFKEFKGLGRAICNFTLQHSVLEKAPPTYIFNIVLPACRRSR
ncbi:hypothetical protein DYB25_004658 [Aphanomyces astaci]|uniref:Uncharacterized protein n=1 Tax=Aphanomyces astaci TaxID=112090 RepID=A0A397AU85_APHAT|nr:hypothetical protein DYB25_004658 [Aphanomyces astaci]RHY48763.1 hypothetical protein DYB34_011592 [Aphanomyces astaci]RHY51311.1 hypothetical protein DYB38_006622 [Aphanomyces astaci]RHY64961.1 hypothetical protein DYB30_010904 [Aphanomyces astaci]RHZ28626.1 hypothetical protein DYB26_010808 [Aphanomyces astaci]